MARTMLVVTHGVAGDYTGKASMKARDILPRFERFISGCALGAFQGATGFDVAQTQATGTLTISSGSGTVGGSINGVSVTVTWGTSDTATATALAAAINASSNALVNKHVTASAAAGVVTLTALVPGYSGNAVTLAASGTGVTASGARLTGGTANSYTF
jgi:phage tail sheath gpL-like